MEKKKFNFGKIIVDNMSTEEVLGVANIILKGVWVELEQGVKTQNLAMAGSAFKSVGEATNIIQELQKKLSGSGSDIKVI